MNFKYMDPISSKKMTQWCKDVEICAATGNKENILKLLKRFSTNTTDVAGNTLLHYVIESNDDNDEIVKCLIEAGFNVNFRNDEGQMVLFRAVEKNKVKTVKILINFGAFTDNTYYPNHIGPLHCAAKGICIEILRMLLETGCNVNAKEKNFLWTPLDNVLYNNRETALEMAKILLDAGASRDHAYYWDSIGPLHKACLNQDPEMVKLLLDAGFKASATDVLEWTPLHAVFTENKSLNSDNNVPIIVKLLIQAGADLNAKINSRETALHFAVSNGYHDEVDLLLKAGAELNVVNKFGDTVLHKVANNNDKQVLLAKRFIEAGVDINTVNTYGQSCIFKAVGCASTELLTFFLKHGAVLNLIDCKDMDLLGHALACWGNNVYLETISNMNFENKNEFLDHDGYLEKKHGKKKIKSQIKCIEILCKHGYDINRIMENGYSLFCIAIGACSHTKVIHTLLRQGVNVNFNTKKVCKIMNQSNYNSKLQQIIIQHAAMCNSLKEGKGIAHFNLKKLSKKQVCDYDNCIEELKGLKVFWVYESMYLINLIEGPVSSRYILNDHLIQSFETGVIAKFFPTFNEILTERFEREREKYELLLKATAGLQSLIKFNRNSFPFIYKNILRFLGSKDLRNLALFV